SNIVEKLNKDRSEEEKRNFIVKTFSVIAVVLFFTGIAFFKVIADRFSDSRNSIIINPASGYASQSISRTQGYPSASASQSGEAAQKFPVYIVGAVQSPGIYEIDGPVYLYRLLELAGGFTSDADRESVNLAFLITENMMIKIPTKTAVPSGDSGGYSSELIVAGWQPMDAAVKESAARININTANIEMLSTLPGIGESTAKAIIDYRIKNGLYRSIQDIMKVSGIKESRFSKIKELITIGK
ncbi:MAG: ComEA family DNA-binding protein, partial [Saccharofermentanales bacterium]